MKTVYSLKEGHRDPSAQSVSLQETSRDRVGSDAWWADVDSGMHEKRHIQGVIRGLWLGQWNSGPAEWALELPNGEIFSGLLPLPLCFELGLLVREFTLGRISEVDYVSCETKNSSESQAAKLAPVVLEIRLGSTSSELVQPIGPCYFTQAAENSELHVKSTAAIESNETRREFPWEWVGPAFVILFLLFLCL